ncbi:MAG: hypothetical protein WCY76_03350 [Leucobacter sp.]
MVEAEVGAEAEAEAGTRSGRGIRERRDRGSRETCRGGGTGIGIPDSAA